MLIQWLKDGTEPDNLICIMINKGRLQKKKISKKNDIVQKGGVSEKNQILNV